MDSGTKKMRNFRISGDSSPKGVLQCHDLFVELEVGQAQLLCDARHAALLRNRTMGRNCQRLMWDSINSIGRELGTGTDQFFRNQRAFGNLS